MVNKQLLEQPRHLSTSTFKFILLNSSCFNKVVLYPSLYFSKDINAAPKAPIIPAIEGLITSFLVNFSKLLKTKSL